MSGNGNESASGASIMQSSVRDNKTQELVETPFVSKFLIFFMKIFC